MPFGAPWMGGPGGFRTWRSRPKHPCAMAHPCAAGQVAPPAGRIPAGPAGHASKSAIPGGNACQVLRRSSTRQCRNAMARAFGRHRARRFAWQPALHRDALRPAPDHSGWPSAGSAHVSGRRVLHAAHRLRLAPWNCKIAIAVRAAVSGSAERSGNSGAGRGVSTCRRSGLHAWRRMRPWPRVQHGEKVPERPDADTGCVIPCPSRQRPTTAPRLHRCRQRARHCGASA